MRDDGNVMKKFHLIPRIPLLICLTAGIVSETHLSMGNEIQKFLTAVIGDHEPATLLEGYASTRKYYRVRSRDRSYVLCLDPEFIDSPLGEYPFLIVHRLFSDAGIPVPRVYAESRQDGLLLLEDLGDTLLEYLFAGLGFDGKMDLYMNLLGILVRIQGLRGSDAIPFSLFFDTEKLMYEFDFFIEHALVGYFHASLTDRDIRSLRQEFNTIAGILDRKDLFVLNHRDFHSRNIIMAGGNPYILDFQHACMGLPQYDLVSLLYDDYVRLDERLREKLKEHYFALSRDEGIHSMARDEFEHYFTIMAFQRSIKAIGSFGFQICARNNGMYKKYIGNTMSYVPGYTGRAQELAGAYRLIKPVFEENL